MLRLPQILIIWLMVLSTASAALPESVDGEKLPTLAPMVKQVSPAVVNISTRSKISQQRNPLLNDPFFRHFFRQAPQYQEKSRPQSLGSGVVIDAEKGLVISNHHVVGQADEITVTLRDGRELKAELLGSDPEADVALLKVPAVALTAIRLADSDNLQVGDFVVAIGNPFGLGQTVTSGIVSAIGRSGLGIEGYEDFIQTDASINPGNSGGALVNLRGELVGMNTAILAPSGGNIGIGFAIPSNMVMQIVEHLESHGEVRRGVLGVVTQDLTPDLAQAFGIKARRGAVVARVFADSAAADAGLRAGDVVVEVNGREVRGAADMRNQVGLLNIGDELRMSILRDGKPHRITAVIGEPKLTSIAGEKVSPRLAGALLAQVQNPDSPEQSMVVIAEVAQGSPAWYARLHKGDIILSVNRRAVEDLKTLQKIVKNEPQLLLSIQRGNQAMFVLLK